MYRVLGAWHTCTLVDMSLVILSLLLLLIDDHHSDNDDQVENEYAVFIPSQLAGGYSTATIQLIEQTPKEKGKRTRVNTRLLY